MVICALLMSTAESAMTADSPAQCVHGKMNFWRSFLIGLLSSLLVKLPLASVAHSALRGFADTAELQMRSWHIRGCMFWCFGLPFSGFCCTYLLRFGAMLNEADEWKWTYTYCSERTRCMGIRLAINSGL